MPNGSDQIADAQNRFMLRSKGLMLDCRSPIKEGAHIMGVLNVTPDSFSDGGLYLDVARAVARATKMAEQGARLIDIGGASSRPKGAAYGKGASLVPSEEELARVLPVVRAVAKELKDVWISVDTFRSDVAEACLDAGAHLINDITALRFDPELASVCSKHNAPLALMHSVGLPGEMPHTSSTDNLLRDVFVDLQTAIDTALNAGCAQLLVDPGFGFGKSLEGNLQLISNLKSLAPLGWPILVGVSRKNSLGQLIARDGVVPPPSERIIPGLALAGIAVDQGAVLVRTHDVLETTQFLSSIMQTRQTLEPFMPYHTVSSD
jgi:dihydropteroate synthase